jgi:hypothetical protein
MTLHQVEFEYTVPEWHAINLDIDPELDIEEKELSARSLIREEFDNISDIEILSIKEIE